MGLTPSPGQAPTVTATLSYMFKEMISILRGVSCLLLYFGKLTLGRPGALTWLKLEKNSRQFPGSHGLGNEGFK